MDQNLEKLVELLEKDREIFQMLRQCPYEILRRFEVKVMRQTSLYEPGLRFITDFISSLPGM